MHRRFVSALPLILALLITPSAHAQLSDPGFKTFSPGGLIRSADVNGNFAVILDQALNRRSGGVLLGNVTAAPSVTFDGVDLSASINQPLLSSSSPTFVGLTLTTLSVGSVSATTLNGNGSGLTGLNASNLASGTVPLARLSGLTVSQFASNAVSQWANDAGYVTAAQAVPSGSIVFTAGSCAAGWTDVTATYQGYYFVVGTPGTTVGTRLSAGENRAIGQHTHTATTTYSWGIGYGGAGTSVVYSESQSSSADFNGPASTTVANAGAVAGTNAPYVQLRACQKQ